MAALRLVAWAGAVALSLASTVALAEERALPKFEFRGHQAGEARSCARSTCNGETTYNEFLGEVRTKVISYVYEEDKLFAIAVLFNTSDFDQMREMLIGRYGEPNKSETGSIQTRAGVDYPTRTVSWLFSDGLLQLSERATRIDVAALNFIDVNAAEAQKLREAEAAREAGRRAF